MKIALLGYGSMGKMVEAIAATSGDEIGIRLRSDTSMLSEDDVASRVKDHDVAIDFSVAGAVSRNVKACSVARVPLVEGTTGWKDQEDEIVANARKTGGTMIYGANFAVGVNLFYRIVAGAASLLSASSTYSAFIEEAHHARKRDAPSGTALHLKALVQPFFGNEITVASTRAGFIPGTHRVGFDSPADQIILAHIARSREGFAEGAILAAHWIAGRRGVFRFSEFLDELISLKAR